MEEDNYGSVLDMKIVDSPREVAMLYDLTYLTVLQTIVPRALPASAIATEVEISLDRVLYRLRALTQIGLARVVHEEPRHGRAMKYYRAVAKTFFAPHATTLELTMAGWRHHQQSRAMFDRIITDLTQTVRVEHGGVDGELIALTPAGTIERRAGYVSNDVFTKIPPHLIDDKGLSYGELTLTREIARELVETLRSAIQRAMDASEQIPEREKKQLYSFIATIAPASRR